MRFKMIRKQSARREICSVLFGGGAGNLEAYCRQTAEHLLVFTSDIYMLAESKSAQDDSDLLLATLDSRYVSFLSSHL